MRCHPSTEFPAITSGSAAVVPLRAQDQVRDQKVKRGIMEFRNTGMMERAR